MGRCVFAPMRYRRVESRFELRSGSIDLGPGEILLESRERLRTLALRLVSDVHRADDVIQDVFLRALDDEPPSDARDGWFARMVKRRAWIESRSDARRRRREQHAARAEALSSVPELAERLETQRKVIEAIERLAEPYQHTILLRYFEGLSAVQIASRLGVSPSAIRSRLQRGLARLREDLNSEYGGQEEWCAAVGLLAQLPAVSGGSGAIVMATGGLVLAMKKLFSVVAIAAILLLGYQAYERWTSGASVEEPGTGSSEVADGRAGIGRDDVPAQGETAPETQRFVEANTGSPRELGASSSSGAEDESSSATDKPPAIIKGRIWRADGLSLEGSRVILFAKGRPGSLIDEEGFFEIETWVERGVTLYLEHKGYVLGLDCDVRPLSGKEVSVEIEVEAGHDLIVEVIDKVTRRPVVDLNMAVRRATHVGQAVMVVRRTDEFGFFRCGFLPEDEYSLDIDVPEYKPVVDRFRVPETGKILVELEHAPQINVVLKNYELHPPQESVLIMASRKGEARGGPSGVSLTGSPDDRGQFQSRSPGPGTWRYQLLASESFPRAFGEFVIPSTEEAGSRELPTVTITLPKPGDVTVTGRLIDSADQAVAGGTVFFGRQSSPVDDLGKYRIESVKVGRHQPRWVRGEGNDRLERQFDEVVVPDQYVFEHVLQLDGSGQLTLSVTGVSQEMLSGIVAFEVKRIDGGLPAHSSYGVKGAHQKLVLDYLPRGLYQIQAHVSFQGVFTLTAPDIEVGEDPVEFAFEYQPPSRWTCEFEFPDGVATPTRVVVVVEQDGQYVENHQLRVKDGRIEVASYREGEYTWTFKAGGCQDVVKTVEVEPDTEHSLKIRFEAGQ